MKEYKVSVEEMPAISIAEAKNAKELIRYREALEEIRDSAPAYDHEDFSFIAKEICEKVLNPARHEL